MGKTYPVTAFVGSIMADSVAAGSIMAGSKRAFAADPVVAGLACEEVGDLKLEVCTFRQCSTEK